MTRCDQCEANGYDHDKIRDLCLSSPYWTGRILLGFDWFANPFHKTLAEWFVKKLEAGKRRFLIMTPRDHLKTSMFGAATLAWRAIKEPEDRVLYVMANCTESEKTLRVVRDLFEQDDKMTHFFPERVIGPNALATGIDRLSIKSTTQYLGLPRSGRYREGTIEARGIDSRMTGGHFTWHIFDDLIDETMKDSVELQNQAKDFLQNSESLFVHPARDVELIIGTWWTGPFYSWLINESGLMDEYESVILGCRVDNRYRKFLTEAGYTTTQKDGDPIWPEHFDDETLRKIARKMGDYHFSHQWMNIPIAESDRRFRREDFQFYNIDPRGDRVFFTVDGVTRSCKFKDMYITMTIDPATGEGSSTDDSAITICGYDQETGAIFCLECWAEKALPFDLIKQVIKMAKRWPTLKQISPEDVSYQKTLKHFLRRALIANKIGAPIRTVKPGSQKKGTRILDALQPFVANHQFYIQRTMTKLLNEAINLQVSNGKVVGKSPNILDSLAYHASNWRVGFSYQDDETENEIDYVDPFWSPEITGPAYGMECLT